MSVHVQTNRILSRLANLTCALEDLQAFAESGDVEYIEKSAQVARSNITAMREHLDKIERQLPVVPLRAVA